MERELIVRHVSLKIDAGFDEFTRNLERLLGRFDDTFFRDIEKHPLKAVERMEKAEGPEGLMLFTVHDHGKLLSLASTPRKARQYEVGNPLIAVTMTLQDIRAGLYAPLRIYVYEGDDNVVRVEYDRPSSLFGQFDDPEITAVARSLDAKLEGLIEKAGLTLRH